MAKRARVRRKSLWHLRPFASIKFEYFLISSGIY